MSVELNLLKALSTGESFKRFARYLNPEGLTDETKWLLHQYKLMFEDGYDYVEPSELFAFAYNKMGVKVKAEQNQKLKTILFNAFDITDEDALESIKSFIESDYALKINDLTNRMIDGDAGAGIEQVMQELENFKKEVQFKEEEEKLKLVSMDLASLIQENSPKDGLKWGLQCLNEVAGCVRQGDLIIVFARPDSGKTSFVIDQTAAWLSQVPEGKQIVWFNNEELGSRIALRYYANIYNEPQHEVKLHHPTLSDKVSIYDAPAIHKRDVEDYLKKHNPAAIVFNTLDKIKGFDKADSDTRRLRDLYQWARELAKQYAPVIAVCQCGADGEGSKTLTMDMLADSKTDKAGEADLIIGIGRTSDGNNLRYINTPKNKLTGTRKDVRQVTARAVEFDPLTGRFRDMNEAGLPG